MLPGSECSASSRRFLALCIGRFVLYVAASLNIVRLTAFNGGRVALLFGLIEATSNSAAADGAVVWAIAEVMSATMTATINSGIRDIIGKLALPFSPF